MMKQLNFLLCLCIFSLGLHAQLDTVYRITKSFDETTNGLKPQRMYCTVTNEQGDTVQLTSYMWSSDRHRWRPSVQEEFQNTEGREVYRKKGWNAYYQKWVGIEKVEKYSIDSLECTFTYEWDNEAERWNGIEGKGLCEEGRLEYYDMDSNKVCGRFKYIGVFFIWEPDKQKWKACFKSPDAWSLSFTCWTLRSINKNIAYYLGSGSLNDIYTSTFVSDDSLMTTDVYYKIAYIYDSLYQHYNKMHYKKFNRAGQCILDSSVTRYFDFLIKDYYSNSSVTEYEYLNDTLISEYIYYNLDSREGERRNLGRQSYEYNEAGRLIEKAYYRWDKAENDWELYKKDETKYADSGELLATNFFIWDEAENVWLIDSKYEYEYDSLGNQRSRLQSEWQGDYWWNRNKTVYSYDESGNRIEHSYANTKRVNFNETEYNKDNDSLWKFYRVSTVNELGIELEYSEYGWSAERSDWEGLSHYEFMLADTAQIKMQLEYCADAGSWCNGTGMLYLYDSITHTAYGEISYSAETPLAEPVPLRKRLYNNDTAYVYDRYSGTYELASKAGYLYYDNKHLREKVVYEYDFSREDWKEQHSTEWYYSLADLEAEYEVDKEYKPLAVAEDHDAGGKLYPTVASNAIFLQLQSAVNRVEICSLSGKSVLKHMYNQSGRIEIDVSALRSGIYYVSVNGTKLASFIKK